MSTRPRWLAGISSSIAELIALYSPPMPIPVMNLTAKNQAGTNDTAVSSVPARYSVSVIMNRRLRPKRSVSCPKTIAPTHAPAMYSDAPQPDTCPAPRPTPAPCSSMRLEIEPTTLTSSPSRIQAVPRPRITSQ